MVIVPRRSRDGCRRRLDLDGTFLCPHKQLGLPILGRHILHDGQLNELPRAIENLRQSRLCRFQPLLA